MILSEPAKELLNKIKARWPDPLTVPNPAPDCLTELRENDLVEQWDMHPNGDRRWMITQAGRSVDLTPPTTEEQQHLDGLQKFVR